MADTGWVNGTVAAQEGSGSSWTNLNNVLADDASLATTSLPIGGNSKKIFVSAPNMSAIGDSDTINGIEYRLKGAGDYCYWNYASLRKNGTTDVGTAFSGETDFTSSQATYTKGGPSNLHGLTWTAAEIKANGFGLAFTIRNRDTDYSTGASIGVVQFKVTYTPGASAPTVTGVDPSSGSTAGGTAITITGTNFTGATGVTIGGVAATSLSVVSSTSITCVTPAGTAGAKDIAVTTTAGTGTLSSGYTYMPGVDIVGELLMETGVPLREESDEELLIEGTGGLDEAANRVVDQWFGMEF